jgi:hypothetical protein
LQGSRRLWTTGTRKTTRPSNRSVLGEARRIPGVLRLYGSSGTPKGAHPGSQYQPPPPPRCVRRRDSRQPR